MHILHRTNDHQFEDQKFMMVSAAIRILDHINLTRKMCVN